mmetsp:Transcript_26603/g.71947  ORF Transcript_26603/g.71947 Transcript_26603/m.71947 type:complete len:121 (-) Transcript_26603:481-843(-)
MAEEEMAEEDEGRMLGGWAHRIMPAHFKRTLCAMQFDEWDDYVYKHGRDNIEAWLRHWPSHFAEDKQYEFAAVLTAWLMHEGPLPREPTLRQRKKANAKKKQQQAAVGGGEGEGAIPMKE